MANRRHVINIRRCLVLAISIAISFGAAARTAMLTGGPYDGIVRNALTGDPIDGALVVAKWMGTTNSIHSSTPLCYYHEVATTGPDGAFHFASWSKAVTNEDDPTWLWYVRPLWIEAYVFKPGYLDHYPAGAGRPPGTISLEPFKTEHIGPRLQFLRKLRSRAGCGGDSNQKERPFAAALAAEAIALETSATSTLSKDDFVAIDGVLLYRDTIDVGYKSAFALFQKRKKERIRK